MTLHACRRKCRRRRGTDRARCAFDRTTKAAERASSRLGAVPAALCVACARREASSGARARTSGRRGFAGRNKTAPSFSRARKKGEVSAEVGTVFRGPRVEGETYGSQSEVSLDAEKNPASEKARTRFPRSFLTRLLSFLLGRAHAVAYTRVSYPSLCRARRSVTAGVSDTRRVGRATTEARRGVDRGSEAFARSIRHESKRDHDALIMAPVDLLIGPMIQCLEAATLGMPFEVWKTRMGSNRTEGTLEAFKNIYRAGGPKAFWAGTGPKMFESASKVRHPA